MVNSVSNRFVLASSNSLGTEHFKNRVDMDSNQPGSKPVFKTVFTFPKLGSILKIRSPNILPLFVLNELGGNGNTGNRGIPHLSRGHPEENEYFKLMYIRPSDGLRCALETLWASSKKCFHFG
jgi:hypothetical protein